MSNENEMLSPADEFASLLPWYVTGKIGAADKAKVDAYLAANPQARIELAIAREEADEIFGADAALEVPHRALDKLKATLASSPSVRISAAKASLIDRIGEFLAGLAPRQLVYAGLTAALAIAVLGGTLGTLLAQRPGQGTYETVTKPDGTTAPGTYALVSFQPAAPAATLSAFLAENKFTIADGPRAGGLYRLRLSDTALEQAAAGAVFAKLSARSDLFASVSPAAP